MPGGARGSRSSREQAVLQAYKHKTSLLSPLTAWALPPPTPLLIVTEGTSRLLLPCGDGLPGLFVLMTGQNEDRMGTTKKSLEQNSKLTCQVGEQGKQQAGRAAGRGQRRKDVQQLSQRASVGGRGCCGWRVRGLLTSGEVWTGVRLGGNKRRIYLLTVSDLGEM